MADGTRSPDSWAVTAGRRPDWTENRAGTAGVVSPPVWRASTILFPTIADMTAAEGNPGGTLYYGRKGTPTSWALCEAMTGLEPGAGGTMLYPSGVAAIAGAMLAVLRAGDHVLIPDNVYHPTVTLAQQLLSGLGVEAQVYDPLAGAEITALFRPNTRLLVLESPGSQTFEVQDIPALTKAARAAGVLTLIDNTWSAGVFFKGIAAGCDMVMQALTKYVGGHSDLMMGSVTATPELFPQVQKAGWLLGACVSPDDAALALRGFRTLPLRLRRHQESALKIARWLRQQPQVARVLHPALPECPGHEFWQRDFTGASGVFGVVLKAGSAATHKADAARFCDDLQMFGIGYSWGGFESLCIPTAPERLRALGGFQAGGLSIRLSIGLEDPDELIADLEAALKRMGG